MFLKVDPVKLIAIGFILRSNLGLFELFSIIKVRFISDIKTVLSSLLLSELRGKKLIILSLFS